VGRANKHTTGVALCHKDVGDPCPISCKQQTDHHLSKAHTENLETLIRFLLSYRREIRDEIIATTEESGFKMRRYQ